MSKKPEIKILLAEDAKTMRKIEVNILNSLGYHDIVEAEDGDHAKKLLQSVKGIDLVISDWNMPNMSGIDLLIWMRTKSKKFKKVPFIMATAQADKAQADKVMAEGGTSIVPKPFSAEELQKKIEGAVNPNEDKKDGIRKTKIIDGKICLRVAHLQITDHLLLGVVKNQIDTGKIKPKTFSLETELMGGWNPVIEALDNNEVDAAFILAPIAMDLFGHGSAVNTVLMAHRGGSILVRNAGGKYEEPFADFFKNKSCLIPHKLSIHHMLSHLFFRGIGLNASLDKGDDIDVNFEVVAPVAMPAFMGSNPDAAAFIVAEPVGSKAVNAGIAKRQFLTNELWPDHPCCVVAMRSEFIEKHPDAAQEFVKYMVKAGKGMAADIDYAVRVGVNFLDPDSSIGLKPALLKKVISDPNGIRWDSLYPSVADFQTIQTYLAEELDIAGDLDFGKFIDFRFADKACSAKDKLSRPPRLLPTDEIPTLLGSKHKSKSKISLKKLLFEKGVGGDGQSNDDKMAQLADDYDLLRDKYDALKNDLIEKDKELQEFKNISLKLFKQGVQCLKNDELFDSAGYFNAVLAMEPENMKALNNLAVIYNEMDMQEKAKTTLKRILQIEPDNEVAHENLAML